jgi:F-type H+-transporting ATPase subunit epsilon
VRLRVLLPGGVLVDEPVSTVRAESPVGWFTLLPRHVDYAAPLVQGLLSYLPAGDEPRDEAYLAVDGGMLVKVGDDVLVATPNAVRGTVLPELHRAIERQFRRIEDHERRARSALDRIGIDIVQRLVELEEGASGG